MSWHPVAYELTPRSLPWEAQPQGQINDELIDYVLVFATYGKYDCSVQPPIKELVESSITSFRLVDYISFFLSFFFFYPNQSVFFLQDFHKVWTVGKSRLLYTGLQRRRLQSDR